MKIQVIVFFLVCSLGVLSARCVAAEYKDEDAESRAYNVTRTVKTVEGLNFVVEEDRPIEKVGSIYRPIDIDSYVAMKFSKLQKSMEDRFAVLEERVRVLESQGARPAAAPADGSVLATEREGEKTS